MRKRVVAADQFLRSFLYAFVADCSPLCAYVRVATLSVWGAGEATVPPRARVRVELEQQDAKVAWLKDKGNH